VEGRLVDPQDEFAVDVELALRGRGVPDPYRSREAVASEVVEFVLRDVALPVEPVDRLDLGGVLRAVGEHPPEERPCLRDVAEAVERLDGEGGVPDPVEPVVPVADAADFLGERGGRGRGDGPRLPVDQQLQHERGPRRQVVAGPGDRAVRLVAVVRPVTPEGYRAVEEFLEPAGVQRFPVPVGRDEPSSVAFVERRRRRRFRPGNPDRHAGGQRERLSAGSRLDALRNRLDLRDGPGVVEPRPEAHRQRDATLRAVDPAVECVERSPVRRPRRDDRHEVSHRQRPARGLERGLQDVGPLPVGLLGLVVAGRPDRK